MDFGGLQALRSDSDSSEEDSSNQSLNDSKFEGVGQPSEKSNQETKTDFESKKKVAKIFKNNFFQKLFFFLCKGY